MLNTWDQNTMSVLSAHFLWFVDSQGAHKERTSCAEAAQILSGKYLDNLNYETENPSLFRVLLEKIKRPFQTELKRPFCII
jgi:hypothetical protein